MNTLVLHGPPDETDVRRWGLSAALVVGVHVALIVAGLTWYTPPDVVGTASEPIMLDLESAPPTLEPQQLDFAPGPQMQEAEPPPPELEQPQEVVQEKVAPTPIQEKPEVVAPPEKPKPKPVVKEKPKPVLERPKKPTEAPAPRTTATPQAAQAARVNYNGLVSAHIRNFRNPNAVSAAGTSGVVSVAFTLSRGGQVLSSRLVASSGSPALDAEAMAMIRRAQPYPAFLADMKESSLAFNLPLRFSLH